MICSFKKGEMEKHRSQISSQRLGKILLQWVAGTEWSYPNLTEVGHSEPAVEGEKKDMPQNL